MLEVLGVPQLLDNKGQFRGTDDLLIHLAEIVQKNRWEIKCILNLTINEKDTPIAISQALLSLLGLKLPYLGRWGSRGQRTRVYGAVKAFKLRP